MKYKNKICILLNWSREVDMYNEIIDLFPTEKIDNIINNIKTLEKERKGNTEDIKKNLINKNKNFLYFSDIYKKTKYKIVISTGLTNSLKITPYSIFRYFYGQTIGRLLDITNISKWLERFLGRPFNADGKKSRIGLMWYPERKIGNTVIKYPTGMDLKLKWYPINELEKNFDIFFTHSEFEKSLINKKFYNKVYKIIGYPRYSKLDNEEKIINNLKKEFKLDYSKKILFWTPTHIHYKKETFKNFLPWIDKIHKLNNDYNIIVRPHPKAVNLNYEIVNTFKQKNFFVDLNSERKIGDLFKISDMVICDYGGTIFDAMYLEKPILLLNMENKSVYVKELIENLSLDIELRKHLYNFDTDVDYKTIKDKILLTFGNEYKEKILFLKKKYFGDIKDKSSSIELIRFLENFLN